MEVEAEQMDNALKAGLTVAISQLLLVNVTYVLSGSRTLVAGIASSLVLLVSWPMVALVYQTLLGPSSRMEHPDRTGGLV